MAGSLRYMAPEVLTGENTNSDPSIDIFSLGCILYALVVGHLPFEGKKESEIIDNIINGNYSYPKKCKVSLECRDLIDSMLRTSQFKRIHMNSIFYHPWIEGTVKKYKDLERNKGSDHSDSEYKIVVDE